LWRNADTGVVTWQLNTGPFVDNDLNGDLPAQPVQARGSVLFERKERCLKQLGVDVVEQRGEPLPLPFPCSSPYAVQRLGHACPAQRPARALLLRIPLGRGPSLHLLLRGLRRFVRRLPSYYGRVRRPVSVHHRLSAPRPMRAFGHIATGHRRDLPGSDAIPSGVMGSSTTAERQRLA
jgi:hypothetical protein